MVNYQGGTGHANTWTAQQAFTGQVATGSVITDDITVQPNAARSTSASVFLDNTAGQIWEFFCDSSNKFGVFDDTGGHQLVTIDNATGGINLHVTSTQVSVSGGDLDVFTAGKGLRVAEGSNAKQGTAVLNGTTAVVVSNSSVTANSRIFLTINAPGGTPASPYVFARSAGVSFSIKSTGASDTSTVAWEIFEPG
jgi:hypothetical protein